MQYLQYVLAEQNLSIAISPSNGHCLFHSFRSSWGNQYNENSDLTTDFILSKCTQEWQSNCNIHIPHIDDSETPVKLQWERYVINRIYNLPIADIFPFILANALRLICVSWTKMKMAPVVLKM